MQYYCRELSVQSQIVCLGSQNVLLDVPVEVHIVDDASSVVQYYKVCTAVTERFILCSRKGHSGSLAGSFYR